MKLRFTKKQKHIIEISFLIIVPLFTFFFWESYLIYPFKIFAVLMHEISHGLAAIFTGGHIIKLDLSESLGGSLVSAGGNHFIIASSGYLGSLLWGLLIYYSTYNNNYFKWLCVFIGTILLIFTANFINGTFGALFGFFYSLLFLSLPFIKYENVTQLSAKTLALISIIYVFTDIKEDLLTLTYRETDAQLLFELTGVAAWIWGLLWFFITSVMIYYLVRFSIKKK